MFKYIKNEMRLIREKDPSIKSNVEALLHPTFIIKIYYRISHYFYKKGHYTIARYIQNRGKKKTGIEIHPGATIGKDLFIDHGTGIVIGETAIVGDNVMIFHGVTVGNNVLIGANATVLGNLNIGDNAKIGAGAVVVHDVEANTTVTGVPAKVVRDYNKRRK